MFRSFYIYILVKGSWGRMRGDVSLVVLWGIMNNNSLLISSICNFSQFCSLFPCCLHSWVTSRRVLLYFGSVNCSGFHIQNSHQHVSKETKTPTYWNIKISKLVPAKQSYPQNCMCTLITHPKISLWNQTAFIPYLEKKKQKCRQVRLLTHCYSFRGEIIYKFWTCKTTLYASASHCFGVT